MSRQELFALSNFPYLTVIFKYNSLFNEQSI